MNYKFCLSSDCGTTHDIEINEEEITWESLVQIIQDNLKMSKVTYFELADQSLSRVGERIRDLDDFQYALKCYQDGMIFKAYGKLVVSSGIIVTKKSSKSLRIQDSSLDSLMTPVTSSYDPLDDFQNNSLRKSSSSSVTPREDLSITLPRETKTIVKKSRQLRSTLSNASSESSASELSETLSPRLALQSTPIHVPVRTKGNSQIAQIEKIRPENNQELIQEATPILAEPSLPSPPVQDKITPPVPPKAPLPSIHEELKDLTPITHEESASPASLAQEEMNDQPIPVIEEIENPIEAEVLDIPELPSQEEFQSSTDSHGELDELAIIPPEFEQPAVISQIISSPKKGNESEKLIERKEEPRALPTQTISHQERHAPEPIKFEEPESPLGRFANTLSLDFSSSLQSIVAGLSRLEDSIGSAEEVSSSVSYTEPYAYKSQTSHFHTSSFDFDFKDPSRPNMASLKTSAELEAERLEQEALEAKIKQEEEAQRLREMMERERIAVLENERMQQQKNHPNCPTIQFTLFNDTSQQASLSITDHAEWTELTQTVGRHFDIESTSITHFVLLDEDDDEISGKLNEQLKFWKIYEKYSTLSGRYFTVYYDPKLAKVTKAPSPVPAPVAVAVSQAPSVILESEEETQVDDRKHVSLYKRDRSVKPKKATDVNTVIPQTEPPRVVQVKDPPPAPPVITEPAPSQTPVEEVYDFRLSTDYIDEQNPISIPKNASWELLTTILLNQLKNISPAQKLTSTVSKISLFDDDGDELVGNIENQDSFWKVISSRYKKNRTIFVVQLMTSPSSSSLSVSSSSTSFAAASVSPTNPSHLPPPSDSHPIFCRLSGKDSSTNQKEIIYFPISSNWEQLNKVICEHWKLCDKKISTVSLFDNENDELFGGITNEKKFWKCYKTHYNKQYTEFVFTLIDTQPPPLPSPAATAPPVPSSSLKTKQRVPNIPEKKSDPENMLPLRFRLFDQTERDETIGIPLNASWDVLVSTLLTHFELDLSEYQVDHIDLVDPEGDLYGTFSKEQKFWKSVQTTYKKGSDLVYVLTLTKIEKKIPIPSASASASLSSEPLVPPEPQATVPTKTIPLNFRLRNAGDAAADSIVEINIPEQASWVELTKTIIHHFNFGEMSVIKSIELVDEDGDDLVGRILNEKKFWKVVATGYSEDTIFILDMNVVKALPPPAPQSQSHQASKPLPSKSSPVTATPTPAAAVSSSSRAKSSSSVSSKSPAASQSEGRSVYFCSSLKSFSKKMILKIPENSSWEELNQILQQSFSHEGSDPVILSSLKLIDEDGDEYCDVITDSGKFWNILNSRYSHSGDLSFNFTWTVAPVSTPVAAPQAKKNGVKVEKKNRIDELPSVPSVQVASSAQVSSSRIPKSKPTRSLPFRLHNEDDSASTEIQIPENGTWTEITQAINQTYNFPSSTAITHVDLLDEDGDEITVGIQNENKFWKFVNKNKMISFIILIWYALPSLPEEQEEESEEEKEEEEEEKTSGHVEEEVEEEAIIPLYFRLSTDSLTDKGVVEIPFNANWEEICDSLAEFFEIDLKSFKIDSLSLVNDDGHELLRKITSSTHFWEIIQTKYHFESMVFVIFVNSLRLQFPFQFQFQSQIQDIGIFEKSNWEEISVFLRQHFSLPSSSSSSLSLSLLDEDGDEIFSKISDERKFWKAAKSKYKKNETLFLITLVPSSEAILTKSTSSSSLLSGGLDSPTTTHSLSSGSSSLTSSSRNNHLPAAALAPAATTTPSAPATVVIKKHKLQSQQQQQPQPDRNPTSSSLDSSKPSTTASSSSSSLSNSRAIPQVDPSKFEGRYVPLSFKLSTDDIDDELLISIPAMGSWDQICNAILKSFPDEGEEEDQEKTSSSTIDRLDLLDDDGNVLLNNIVSSSKFWKSCLEQYRENETIFNVFIHRPNNATIPNGNGTSTKPDTSGRTGGAIVTKTKKSGHGNGEGGGGSRGVSKKSKSSSAAVTFESFLSACCDNNSELVTEIISQNVLEITAVDDRGLSAAHVSAINGSLDVLKLLFDYSNTFIALRDHEGMTPLHYACELNQTPVVRYLIESGADIAVRNKMGMTCLHYMAINGNMELATAYIAENLINVATNSGLTLLHFAADMGHVAMVKYLLLRHANVHCRDDEGLIPLHLACISNHLDCVKILITLGGSYCNLRDDEGMSCLLHACKEGNIEIVKYLCEPPSPRAGAGAGGLSGQGNLLARNDHYDSCLHLACTSGSLPLVKYLLQKKLDINARNDKNETPLEVASKVGDDAIANWLEDRGGGMRPETKDEMATRKQIDMKSEKAIRAFEAEEFLNIER